MSRPSFSTAWAASMRIYDVSHPAKKVANIIGGNVAINVNNPNPKERWDNTCAVRLSFILNQSGFYIPRLRGKTVTGGDNKQYFYRVRDLIAYLRSQWGEPEVVAYPPAGGGNLAKKKGIILFEIQGWSDAQGHATLWDGSGCYDQCYFNEPGVHYRTERANFWSLS